MYVKALGAISTSMLSAKQIAALCPPPKEDGSCTCKGWWLDRTSTDVRLGRPGVCRAPDAKVTITDHRKTAESGGKVTVYERTQSGTKLVGTKPSPVWEDCQKRGLDPAECYKRRMTGMKADDVEAQMKGEQQAALDQAQRKRMRTYFVIGGVAVAGIIALRFLRG